MRSKMIAGKLTIGVQMLAYSFSGVNILNFHSNFILCPAAKFADNVFSRPIFINEIDISFELSRVV